MHAGTLAYNSLKFSAKVFGYILVLRASQSVKYAVKSYSLPACKMCERVLQIWPHNNYINALQQEGTPYTGDYIYTHIDPSLLNKIVYSNSTSSVNKI